MCHAKGVGVERDLAQAYAWLSLAAERDFPKALYSLSLLEAEMAPANLQDGRRRLTALRRTIKTSLR
jgi:TPR repeat protein